MTTYFKKVRGIDRVQRILRRLEPEEVKSIQYSIARAAKRIERDAIGYAIAQDIRLSGDMIESIETHFVNKKMSALIGPSAKNARVRGNPFDTSQYSSKVKKDTTWVADKEAQWNLMKAWWAEFGTGPPAPQDEQPFMNPAFRNNERRLQREVRLSVNKVLKKISRGG